MENKKLKIICVAAARPNFMKIAPLMEEIKKHKNIEPVLVHTGQHYDYNMSGSFFDELNIPKPDYNLGIKASTHGEQTGKTMIEFEKVCLKENPDLVVVVGDVNATIATALTAKKLHIKVAHIEAGLRSFDRSMPEEINRILTDQISDFLFVTEPSGIKNLKKEGISDKKIFRVGNIMIDNLINLKEKALKSDILDKFNLKEKEYGVLTLHRPSNVDNKRNLEKLINTFKEISQKIPLIFPIHPRTKKQIKKFNLSIKSDNIKIVPPVTYLEMLHLMAKSRFVATDSGGMQEETTMLNIPCLTIRENTERPITIEKGTNTLVDTNKKEIKKEVDNILNNNYKKSEKIKYWDGKTAQRIIKTFNTLQNNDR